MIYRLLAWGGIGTKSRVWIGRGDGGIQDGMKREKLRDLGDKGKGLIHFYPNY